MRSAGYRPRGFLETVNSALFQSPFYAAYGKVMLHPPEKPGATIDLGAKDLRLFREAAAAGGRAIQSGRDSGRGLRPRRKRQGLGDEDWAVGQYKMAQRRSKPEKAPHRIALRNCRH